MASVSTSLVCHVSFPSLGKPVPSERKTSVHDFEPLRAIIYGWFMWCLGVTLMTGTGGGCWNTPYGTPMRLLRTQTRRLYSGKPSMTSMEVTHISHPTAPTHLNQTYEASLHRRKSHVQTAGHLISQSETFPQQHACLR